ncbi:MAG: hypothetical protein RIR53_1983 [Bacteroidota bacterium]|jgi:hypothetical protein
MRYIFSAAAVTVVVLLCAVANVAAQIRPSRTWESTPQRGLRSGVMTSLVGGGEFQRSYGSAFDEQAWQFRTHLQAEPYRFSDTGQSVIWTTTIEAHQEMTANPYNDISFNPRTMRWEEFFWLHVITEGFAARVGFVHRCKHDIDNLSGADEGNPISPLQAEQRTLILTGPTIAASVPSLSTRLGTVTASAGAEWFLNSSDTRRGGTDVGSWAHMQGAAWMRAQCITRISRDVAVLTSAFACVPWFESRQGASPDVPYEARGELALSLTGATARVDIALVAERSFDEPALTFPVASSYVGLCVRFMPQLGTTE